MPGANAGSSDLNFANDTPVSKVLKGLADVELKKGNYGVFARAKAWQDFALTDDNHAYGNYPNGFTPGAKLSDNGFNPDAKFSNAEMVDYYVFGKFNMGASAPVDVKVGSQFLNWGAAKMVGGGINVINPLDVPGALRPGATPEESKIPVGMISASLQNSKSWGAEAFVQYEFKPNVYPGCGTFYQTTNYVPTGCNYVSVLPTQGDAQALGDGLYAHRNPDVNASDAGQFGLSLRLSPENMNTDFKLYAMNLHSRAPSIRVYNNVAGVNYNVPKNELNTPTGLKYGLVYAENVQIAGASFESKLNPTTQMFGEVAYRANQPINFNASDLIASFLTHPSNTLSTNMGINGIASGASFDGYQRFAVTNLSLGTSKVFPTLMGAERMVVVGEIGMSSIAGLPGTDTLHFGRSDDFGQAPLSGVTCTPGLAAVQCAQDGFITSFSWGYRLRVEATYSKAVVGATVTPSLYYSQDVSGYSYDGTYLQGRSILRPGVRFDWGKKYFAEAAYNDIYGGTYNNMSDRSTFTVFAGMQF